MIVETMSYTEIATCFRKELVKYVPKIQAYADKFSSTVKKTRMYPVSRTYTFDTKDKLRIVMHFVAQKRSDWNPVMYWEQATSSHLLAYKKYESDDVTPLAARIGTGCCFAEMVEHGIFVFKTVISDEMLKEGQQTRIFAEMEAKRHRQSVEEGFKGR